MDFLADLFGGLLTGAAFQWYGNRGLGPQARRRRAAAYARGEQVSIPVRWEDHPPLNIDGSPRATFSRVPDTLNGRLTLTCLKGELIRARPWDAILGEFEPFWQRVSAGLRAATIPVVEDGEERAIHVRGTGFQASPVMLFASGDFEIVLDCLGVPKV